jgi:bifunctional UDP-N-acetylglucosamine pyrophosphorylase/glucosamine-1-phosphate N-acetyltransferase
LRSNVVVEDNVCLGNFVEVKNSFVGKNSKAKHLTYVGDATIGQSVNIGAGTVFCNYDGKNKHKAIVEDGAFVGSNNTLISPVKIGKGAYVAAGSTITKDVPAQDLAIARARQENKAGYANKLGKKKFMGAVKTRGGEEIL